MTIEEKAKRYDEVREKIALRFGSNVAEEIFSEFEISEDEKIRKAIIELVKQSSEILDKQNQNNMIVWLEKQKEYESTDFEYVWNRTDCGALTSALDKYSEEAIINMCHAWYDKGIELERKSWLEKQGEQKHRFVIGDIISNGKVEFRVDNIVKNAIGQDCYFLVNIEDEKNGIRYLQVTNSEGKTYNYGEITWICEQVDAKFEKQGEMSKNCPTSVQDKSPININEMVAKYSQTKDGDFGLPINCQIRAYRQGLEDGINSWKPAWSEEDDYNVQCLVAKANCDIQKGNVGRNEELIDWLKSLRNRVKSQPDMVEALRTEYEKGRADTIAEMKSSWSEEDIKKPNGGIVLEDFNDGNGFYKVNLAYLNEEQVKEIEELVKRWDCQPKENEDESIISDLLDYFDEDKCLKHEVNDVVKWLKTIKPQPKQKWSKDDERVIAIINNALTESNTPPDDYDKVYDWLESIKQRM